MELHYDVTMDYIVMSHGLHCDETCCRWLYSQVATLKIRYTANYYSLSYILV